MEAAELANLRIQQSYTKEKKIGEGTYASVYEGHQKKSNRKVAIKKIKAGQFKDGLDMSAIREVKFLQELSHPNVISLLDVFSSKSNLNLVLEFLDTDLEAVIKDRELVFQASDIKSWMLMTMQGLDFCHQNWVLHRDMKPNNLLIASDGTLKIADFGLAREYADPGTRMTCQVVTRWYRPPELLYGARAYSTGVDIWAVGCIFAELMLRTPYLAGENDFDQLNTIFRALGTPTDQDWPGHKRLADYVEFPKQYKQPLDLLFSAAGDDAIDFLECCLKFDPRKRINSRQVSAYWSQPVFTRKIQVHCVLTCNCYLTLSLADDNELQSLRHQYFNSTPYPTCPQNLPKPKGALVPRQIAPQDDGAGGADGRNESGLKKRKSVVANLNKDVDIEERAPKIARRLDFG
ncbi:hypothetical protein Pst134EB_014545 [Puccinia striiformis f. sp. tritici]|nr:hypothetical protein Pst134EB_014545 [Puccinia striiformis f. sp. tritici]